MNHIDFSSHRKRPTGVTLDIMVCDYLDHIASQEERTRSQVINRIVKEHANRNGIPLNSQRSAS